MWSTYNGLGILMGTRKMRMKRHNPRSEGIYNLVWRQEPTIPEKGEQSLLGKAGGEAQMP